MIRGVASLAWLGGSGLGWRAMDLYSGGGGFRERLGVHLQVDTCLILNLRSLG